MAAKNAPHRHVADAAFHARAMVRCLDRARAAAPSKEEHDVLTRLVEGQRSVRRILRHVDARLRS